MPLISPHSPIAPNAQFKGSSHAGGYGDYVQETDWVVSEILKAVDEAGIGSNTMVVFTSDNGSPETDGENYYGKIAFG